jgi:glycerol-3-phosphate acyltransferase PlsX
MRIALDAMGGDNAPQVNVAGAIEGARDYGVEIILVGDSFALRRELLRYSTANLKITVESASQIIAMDESPTAALRQKKDSSITRAIYLVKEGKADAAISAGNTGAMMAASKVILGTLKGVDRPAIATIFPTLDDPCVILDVGANVDCKPQHLLQFAIMGSIYSRYILGIEKPKVGLLSIGQEEIKGNELTRESYKLLQKSSLNFVGNVEGKDIFKGEVDVIVCDGFIGNIVLKASESMAELFDVVLREELTSKTLYRFGAKFCNKALKNFSRKIDYAEHGGAPLLGVNGASIISHGHSSSRAIKNAIRVSKKLVEKRVNFYIGENLAENTA